MSCDLSEILERTRPPDPELVDLIEQAFLEGQIDGQKANQAYLWLMNSQKVCAIAERKRQQRKVFLPYWGRTTIANSG